MEKLVEVLSKLNKEDIKNAEGKIALDYLDDYIPSPPQYMLSLGYGKQKIGGTNTYFCINEMIRDLLDYIILRKKLIKEMLNTSEIILAINHKSVMEVTNPTEKDIFDIIKYLVNSI